jgi:WD40 repeat protein
MGLQRWPIRFVPEQSELQVGPAETLSSAVLEVATLAPRAALLIAAAPRLDRADLLAWRDGQFEKPIEIPGHPGAACVAISPDERWFATGTWKGTGVVVWRTETLKPVKELPVQGDATCAFSPDGQWLVTASAQEYRFWAVPSWEPARSLSRDRAGDIAGLMVFSPDGRILAVLHGRNTGVKLVSTADGQELATLEAGRPLSFSPDNCLLATAAEDQTTLLLWDLRLIRQRLADMGLDWDLPGLPPAAKGTESERLVLRVLTRP